QDEQARHRQHIKDEHREDDVIEQFAVRTGKREQRPPNTLQHQRVARHTVAVQFAYLFEEKSILRHRVIDSRPGQDDAIDTAEGGTIMSAAMIVAALWPNTTSAA